MATIFRGPLKAPDFRAYVNAATFAALVGTASVPMAIKASLPPPDPHNDLGVAQENIGPAFLQRNVALIPVGPPNLQQTTLAVVVVAAPFHQLDWPNPRGYPPLNVGDVEGFSSSIRGVAHKPFHVDAWPVTPGKPPLNVGDVEGFTSTVRGEAHRPFVKTDWPVPRGAPPANPDEVQGFPSPIRDYASGLNDANKRPSDWPVPRGPQHPIDLRTWTENLLQTTLAPAPATPFFETDWPVPKGLGPRQADTTGFPQPIRDYAGGLNDANKRPSDWPVPKGPQWPVELRTWLQSLQGTTLRPGPFPQTDWPVPKGLGPRQALSLGFSSPIRDYAEGLNSADKPVLDWPVPPGPQRSIDALTWTQSLVLGITAQSTKPFLQSDWPLQVPRVYRQIAETRGFELPILNYAVGLNNANRRKYDWPNPWGRPPLNVGSVQGLSEPVRQSLVFVANFREYDWPVPIGKPPLNVGSVAGFSEPLRRLTIPFAHLRNDDWPVPKGRPPLNVGWSYSRPPFFPIGFNTYFVSVTVTVTVDSVLGKRAVCVSEQSDAFVTEAEDGTVWSDQSEQADNSSEEPEDDPWGCET